MNKELKRIATHIVNFEAEADDWKEIGTTKEDLMKTYNSLRDIPESMSISEMWLIWYLRETRLGESNRFYRLAKQNYETHWNIINLRTPQSDGENVQQ